MKPEKGSDAVTDESVSGVSVAGDKAESLVGSPIIEPEVDNTTTPDKKITVDNAVRTLADKFFAVILGKLPEGRTLLAAEEIALKASCVKKALAVKVKEESVRNERRGIAELLKVDIMAGLSFLNGNAALTRYALDKIAAPTIKHRVGQRNTRTGDDVAAAIHLEDDLASLLGEIDIDDCLEEMTDLRDTRSRSLGGTKKPKAENDPLFAEIESVVPTLIEILMEHGKEVALYCMKSIGKDNDFAITRMQAKEGVDTTAA